MSTYTFVFLLYKTLKTEVMPTEEWEMIDWDHWYWSSVPILAMKGQGKAQYIYLITFKLKKIDKYTMQDRDNLTINKTYIVMPVERQRNESEKRILPSFALQSASVLLYKSKCNSFWADIEVLTLFWK